MRKGILLCQFHDGICFRPVLSEARWEASPWLCPEAWVPSAIGDRPRGRSPQTELDPALLPKPFTRQFSVPTVAAPDFQDADTDYYSMSMLPVQADIIPGMPTTMWGYAGRIPARPSTRCRAQDRRPS